MSADHIYFIAQVTWLRTACQADYFEDKVRKDDFMK